MKKKNRKQILRLVSVGLFAVAVLLIGVFSLAYLTSKDEVTNQVKGEETEIKLFEPAWFEKGMQDSEKLVPGMIIDKDPFVTNVGKNDVYIRMKIDIKIGDTELEMTDERYKKIISTICIDETADEGDPEKLPESISPLMNETFAQSHNDSFIFQNGWFYYVDKATKDYKILKPGEDTERLFYELHIPVFKNDYLGYFDKPFTITVVAQGIPVVSVTDFSQIESVFQKYADNITSDNS